MHKPHTKLDELSWVARTRSAFVAGLGVRPLAIIIILSSLLFVVACFGKGRVSGSDSPELVGLIIYWMILGPVFCLFLSGMLTATYFRTGKKHTVTFGFGMVFGLAAFALWLCLYS
jgi:hypothetical protein